MKKIVVVLLIFILILGMNQKVQAQTSILQKILEDLEELVKPEKNQISLKDQIQIFQKIIDLSLNEVKDLKIKILALENLDPSTTKFLEEKIFELNEVIKYYEDQKEEIEKNKDEIDERSFKILVQEFKAWREKKYLPLIEEVSNFLLIHQIKTIEKIALNRYQKIKNDLEKLKKKNLKGIDKLLEELEKAGRSINEALQINERAIRIFWGIEILTQTSTTSSMATSSFEEVMIIKDLVQKSLNKIKEAYEIFIEMSKQVRGLLF